MQEEILQIVQNFVQGINDGQVTVGVTKIPLNAKDDHQEKEEDADEGRNEQSTPVEDGKGKMDGKTHQSQNEEAAENNSADERKSSQQQKREEFDDQN